MMSCVTKDRVPNIGIWWWFELIIDTIYSGIVITIISVKYEVKLKLDFDRITSWSHDDVIFVKQLTKL